MMSAIVLHSNLCTCLLLLMKIDLFFVAENTLKSMADPPRPCFGPRPTLAVAAPINYCGRWIRIRPSKNTDCCIDKFNLIIR